MSAHAACSPSSGAMWLNCPASVTQTKGLSRPSSKYAREGTAAHTVAEMVINGDLFLPDRIEVEGQEFIVSPGLCRDINPYIAHVQALRALPGSQTVIERRVVIPQTRNMVWGTIDCGTVEITDDMHVSDLKYGRGVAVDPESPQLKLYALGLAGLFKVTRPTVNVTMTVCQPRVPGGPLRSHRQTLGELIDWRASVVKPALAKISAGDPTEVAGHWCRWCVRQLDCKAFAGRHQKHAAAAFDDPP